MPDIEVPLFEAGNRFLTPFCRCGIRSTTSRRAHLDGNPVAEILPLGDPPPRLTPVRVPAGEPDAVRIQRLPGMGRISAQRILAAFGTIKAFVDADPGTVAQQLEMRTDKIDRLQRRTRETLHAPPSFEELFRRALENR